MRIMTFKPKEEWQRFNEEFLAGIPVARARFQDRADAANLVLDGTVESLGPVGDWLYSEVVRPLPPWHDDLPAWWDPDIPLAVTDAEHPAPVTLEQIVLVDEVHSYFVEVLFTAYPDAKWVIFKARGPDLRKGSTLLRLREKKRPTITIVLPYYMALHAIDGRPAKPGELAGFALHALEAPT